MSPATVPNILAERYASTAMKTVWSAEAKIRLERRFWIAVMRAQAEQGLPVPEGTVAAYEAVVDRIDLASIDRRERESRHDVKARIDEFCTLAGCEHIHKGMTSRDLTENVEQLQVLQAIDLIRDKAVAALTRFRNSAEQWQGLPLTARTHNVPAQLTTLGKRMAMFGEELIDALDGLQHHRETYALRGLKGAVGTQLDLLSLFDGQADKVAAVESSVLAAFEVPAVRRTVGQVYPRSQDAATVSAVAQVAMAPSSFAKTLRLMAGEELASEGFLPGQTGSSAMPHKMNSRSCERINGLYTIIQGHLAMGAALAGDQWNEGDVACSVVRRVLLPDLFFAVDGLLETLLTVLDQMTAYPAVIDRENRGVLPFLLTTTFLMEAVRAGMGREAAHALIKKHALATVNGLRDGSLEHNDLVDRLAADPAFPVDRARLEACVADGLQATGMAERQVAAFAERVDPWLTRFPEAAGYRPGAIL